MDKKQTLDMIAAISNAKGVSGFEDEVVDAMLPALRRYEGGQNAQPVHTPP